MSIVRLAFFEGHFKPGGEPGFYQYAREKLVPLWTAFPQLAAFRMHERVTSDDGAPPYLMVLAFTYPSTQAMTEALASSVRSQSREMTKGLFAYFEGRITHVVAEATDFIP